MKMDQEHIPKKRKLEDDDVDDRCVNSPKETAELARDSQSSAVESQSRMPEATPREASGFGTGGFAAYAKTNPFLAAANSKKGFGFGPPSLTLSTTAVATKTAHLPALIVSSPKSPKPNPFSSPSPAHNPFVTIVESKDELWQTMAQDKLTSEEAEKIAKKPKTSHPHTGGHYSSSYFGDSYASREKEEITLSNDSTGNTIDSKDDSKPANVADEVIVNIADTADAAEVEDQEAEEPGESSPGRVYTTYALPENVVIVTGEEDDDCLLQTRAKLYRLEAKSGQSTQKSSPVNAGHDDDTEKDCKKSTAASNSKLDTSSAEWIEIGVGPVKVLQSKTDSDEDRKFTRLVVRREDKKGGVGIKLIMNVRLDQFVSVAKQGDKLLRMVCLNVADPIFQLPGHTADVFHTYLLRSRTVEESESLFDILVSIIQKSKSSASEENGQTKHD